MSLQLWIGYSFDINRIADNQYGRHSFVTFTLPVSTETNNFIHANYGAQFQCTQKFSSFRCIYCCWEDIFCMLSPFTKQLAQLHVHFRSFGICAIEQKEYRKNSAMRTVPQSIVNVYSIALCHMAA